MCLLLTHIIMHKENDPTVLLLIIIGALCLRCWFSLEKLFVNPYFIRIMGTSRLLGMSDVYCGLGGRLTWLRLVISNRNLVWILLRAIGLTWLNIKGVYFGFMIIRGWKRMLKYSKSNTRTKNNCSVEHPSAGFLLFIFTLLSCLWRLFICFIVVFRLDLFFGRCVTSLFLERFQNSSHLSLKSLPFQGIDLMPFVDEITW